MWSWLVLGLQSFDELGAAIITKNTINYDERNKEKTDWELQQIPR